MDQRKFNIYFHTHTISGIIIAALLYVMFFAGTFSFFKEELSAWQKGESLVLKEKKINFNNLLDSLSWHHNLRGRNFGFYIKSKNSGTFVNMSATEDPLLQKQFTEKQNKGTRFFNLSGTNKTTTYAENYDIGEFLYRLHFFAPLNEIPINIGEPFGYVFAGIVAFIFLFALITGLLLHWDKIKSNFFLFRPKTKWKTLWTDLHTVLGVIGFPYQFVYALTGIILIANFVLIVPYTKFLYNSDKNTMNEELQNIRNLEVPYLNKPLNKTFDVNSFVEKWQKQWTDSEITHLYLKNYGDKSMQAILEAKPHTQPAFAGSRLVIEEVESGKILKLKSPETNATYIDRMKSFIYRLHFGDFGGYFIKVIYFVLGLFSCMVIISGILIWLVARDKKNIPVYKRKFNFWASNIFLSTSLSLLPVTAFTLIVLKYSGQTNQSLIYSIFFYSWLTYSLVLISFRSLTKMNKQVLLSSFILCALVPVSNALYSENHLWNAFKNKATDILLIDLLFILLSLLSIMAYFQVKKKAKPFKSLDF